LSTIIPVRDDTEENSKQKKHTGTNPPPHTHSNSKIHPLKPEFHLETSKNSPQNIILVRLEVFTAVTMKNGVLWDVTPRGACKNRRFGGT
jgi:hypothetical protein